jgi:hypothetical protein
VVHGGVDRSKELGRISGGRRVMPTRRVLPHNVIFGMVVKVKTLDGRPEGYKLTEVLYREVGA